MCLPLHANYFQKLSVQRKCSGFVVFRSAWFETYFALVYIDLIPLNREHYSNSHSSKIHSNERASCIFGQHGT